MSGNRHEIRAPNVEPFFITGARHMATANKKRSATAADKAPETAQPDQHQHEAVKAERKFDNADELAHFIHHNPEFGTLPLDEQNALRQQLVTLAKAAQ
jgi:hypothetical protein